MAEFRDDVAVLQARARAQQPKMGGNPRPCAHPVVVPVQVHVQYDHPGANPNAFPNSMADQIDASRVMRVYPATPQRVCGSTQNYARFQSVGAAFDPYNQM